MSAKLTVTTEVGTFTRRTNRTYSHIVVVRGERAEVLEAHRLTEIQSMRGYIAEYEETIRTGVSKKGNTAFHREHTTTCIADGSYAKWIAEYQAEAEKLTAAGPITVDDADGGWTVLHWCGRHDLATTAALTFEADHYREVRIYTVDTGECVHRRVHGAQSPESYQAQRDERLAATRRRSGRRWAR